MFLNEFILNLAKYNDLKKDIRLDIIDGESKRIGLAKIRFSVIQLIDDFSPIDIDVSFILFKFMNDERHRKIISYSEWQEYNPNKEISSNSSANFHFEMNILSWFFDGQKLKTDNLNSIISAINLSESAFNLPLTKLKPFENGEAIKANHFNRFMSPIENLESKIGNVVNWEYFPLKDGEVLNAKKLNEIISKLNELVKFSLYQKK